MAASTGLPSGIKDTLVRNDYGSEADVRVDELIEPLYLGMRTVLLSLSHQAEICGSPTEAWTSMPWAEIRRNPLVVRGFLVWDELYGGNIGYIPRFAEYVGIVCMMGHYTDHRLGILTMVGFHRIYGIPYFDHGWARPAAWDLDRWTHRGGSGLLSLSYVHRSLANSKLWPVRSLIMSFLLRDGSRRLQPRECDSQVLTSSFLDVGFLMCTKVDYRVWCALNKCGGSPCVRWADDLYPVQYERSYLYAQTSPTGAAAPPHVSTFWSDRRWPAREWIVASYKGWRMDAFFFAPLRRGKMCSLVFVCGVRDVKEAVSTMLLRGKVHAFYGRTEPRNRLLRVCRKQSGLAWVRGPCWVCCADASLLALPKQVVEYWGDHRTVTSVFHRPFERLNMLVLERIGDRV
jgi:hypothetical protein